MLVATAVAAALPIVTIALARRVALSPAVSIALAVVGAAGLGFLALHGWTSRFLLPVALGAQLAAATGIGSLVGYRVQHAGHVLPAAAIAAACDVLSVLHPMGASRAIAESASALPVLAAGAPVPGTMGITFALGVGDLTFTALLFAVVVRHGLAWTPLLAAVLAGVAASLGLSAAFAVPVPALVAIGAFAVVVVPAFRDVRRTDRAATRIAIFIAFAVVTLALSARTLRSSRRTVSPQGI